LVLTDNPADAGLHQPLIPTKWNSYWASIRERTENLSERRLKSLSSLCGLHQVRGQERENFGERLDFSGLPTHSFSRLVADARNETVERESEPLRST
jgi:hypothetical protein